MSSPEEGVLHEATAEGVLHEATAEGVLHDRNTAPYVKMEPVTVKMEVAAEWPQPYSIFTAAWPGADPAEPPSLYLTQKRMVEGSELHSIFFSLLKEYNHHEWVRAPGITQVHPWLLSSNVCSRIAAHMCVARY